LEEEFGTKECDMQQQVMSQEKNSGAYLVVYEQDSKRKTKLGEPNLKLDDDFRAHRIETHYASMHMDEEDTTKIAEREAKTSICEREQENINAQGLHCNVDDVDDGQSHCDETHVDDDYKVICELVNPIAVDVLGEVEIFNEINNEHIHAWISHHSVDENHVDMCGFLLEIGIDSGNMVSEMFDETLKVEAATLSPRYEVVVSVHEAVCHLETVDDQEKYKVIEEFLMRISTKNITMGDKLHAVEKKIDVE